MLKNPPANAEDGEDEGSIPGLGRSLGGGHGSPLQYSCLENPMDRGAWQGSNELDTKIRDTKGTFHTKMGSIKDRNGMDLTEAKDIKKSWQEYTEELTIQKRSS